MLRVRNLLWCAVPCALSCAPLYPPSEGTLGPASAEPGSTEAQALGCWTLDWQLRGDVAARGQTELPDSIELGDSPIFVAQGWALTPATHPAGRGLDGDVVAAGDETWERRYRTSRWTVTGETIEVFFTDAASFWALSMALQGEEIVGLGSFYEQEGPDEALVEATVVGERFPCSDWSVGPGPIR